MPSAPQVCPISIPTVQTVFKRKEVIKQNEAGKMTSNSILCKRKNYIIQSTEGRMA